MTNAALRKVLIVGTGNVARSVMGEAYINARPQSGWLAASAGAAPAGAVSPLTITVLAESDLRPPLRSKSWEEFAGPTAPVMDVVITICDRAAALTAPVWPGTPRLLHWPIPDPLHVEGRLEERLETYRAVFTLIRRHVDSFLAEERTAARS